MSKSFSIVLIGVWFFVMENIYFGWNRSPNSDAELLADGMVLMMMIFAIMCREGK
jgi:hypothetical protein